MPRPPTARTARLAPPPRVNDIPRLHVNTGPVCNNNCGFCAEDDRAGRERIVRGQAPGELDAMLASFPFRDHVCFTTGEPTLNPLLPWLLRRARDLGYSEVALITNGRRLADAAFLGRLLDAGLNLLTVSVHGATPRLHDSLTRTPGSFAQTIKGVANARGRTRLHTSTVVSRRNLDHIAPLLVLLGRLGVEQAVLNVVKPRGRADTRARHVVASYPDVVRAVAAALAAAGTAAPPAFVEDVPACAARGLPPHARGVLEHNLRYDLVARPDGPARYEELDRAATEGDRRATRDECRRCVHDAVCPGVWARYLDLHGWAGLDPIEGPLGA